MEVPMKIYNNYKFNITVCTYFFLTTLIFSLFFQVNYLCLANEIIEKQLDNLVDEIRSKFFSRENAFSSQTPPFWELDSYKQFKRVDHKVLIPKILEKIYGIPRNSLDFVTISWALSNIINDKSLLDGIPEYDPWCGEPLWIRWYGGYEFSQERFDFLYNLLLQKRKEKDESKMMMINEALRSQGIFMLSFLMEKIIEGDHELLPIVQKMFNKFGNELKGKSKEDILAWWKDNKEKYQLPPKDPEKYCYLPSFMINTQKKYSMEEKIYLLYDDILGWKGRHLIQGTAPSQRETSRQSIELAKLIGYENTPQFHFLVDLGEEALPYLFLKLKEEKEQFTLPIIEKIMGKKLPPKEIEQHIEAAEELLNKPEPIVTREWTDIRGAFSIEAKYVSSKKGKVTLEKSNGSIITVEISKLSTNDQDYIKRQQTAEKTKQPK
jgi:hypothetical protein